MKMNLPNKLTVLRILLVPVFLLLFMFRLYFLACLVFVAASLTDLFDGKIAREQGLVTNLGKFLDPIADKVLTTAAFVAILGTMGGEAAWLWVWCLVLMLAREFVVATVRMMAAGGGEVVAADMWGKVKTVMQYVVIIFVLVLLEVSTWNFLYGAVFNVVLGVAEVLALLMMVVTTVATVISGVRYVKQNWHFIGEDS